VSPKEQSTDACCLTLCDRAASEKWHRHHILRRARSPRMGWTGRAPAPNGFRWGLRSARSTSPCPIRQPLQSLTPLVSTQARTRPRPSFVCSSPRNGHQATTAACPFGAKRRHSQSQHWHRRRPHSRHSRAGAGAVPTINSGNRQVRASIATLSHLLATSVWPEVIWSDPTELARRLASRSTG